jgi:hypothetical protein
MNRPADIEGVRGKAWRIELPDVLRSIDHSATLGQWLMEVPEMRAQLGWDWYMLAVISLADIPGQSKPATKRYPEAEYELLMLAVHPSHVRPVKTIESGQTVAFLHPPNLMEQFHGCTDEQAAELGAWAVRAMLEDRLPIEPMIGVVPRPGMSPLQMDFAGFTPMWRAAIEARLSDMKGAT